MKEKHIRKLESPLHQRTVHTSRKTKGNRGKKNLDQRKRDEERKNGFLNTFHPSFSCFALASFSLACYKVAAVHHQLPGRIFQRPDTKKVSCLNKGQTSISRVNIRKRKSLGDSLKF